MFFLRIYALSALFVFYSLPPTLLYHKGDIWCAVKEIANSYVPLPEVIMVGKFHKQISERFRLSMLLNKIKMSFNVQVLYLYNSTCFAF